MARPSTSLIVRLALAAVLVAAPRVAAAQNLLVNPHFNTDISSWSGAGASFDSTQDAAGSPSSGSALETITLPNIGVPLNQCIGVVAGTSYDFGGTIRPTLLSNGGGAGITVVFFQGGGCSGISSNGPVTPLVTTTGTFSTVSTSVVAPPLSVSAEVLVGFSQTGNFQANFDDMFFQPSAAVPAMPQIVFLTMVGLSLLLAAMTLRNRARRGRTA